MSRLLTLDDLYSFFIKNNQNITFESKEEQHQINVQLFGSVSYDEDKKMDIEGLTPVTLKCNHTKKNLNGSFITDEAQEKALNSIYNRPILGFIHEVDGEPEFYTHNFHEKDDELIYDEYPVGIIPESGNVRIKYDKKAKKNYVVVDGYIFDLYSKAKDILERDKECSVSVEISIRDMEYDKKKKLLIINDFYYTGITILGCDESGNKINPGMKGSNITLKDFEQESNSLFFNKNIENELIQTLKGLNEVLLSFDIDGRKECGDMNKKYAKKKSEIDDEEVVKDDETKDLEKDQDTEKDTKKDVVEKDTKDSEKDVEGDEKAKPEDDEVDKDDESKKDDEENKEEKDKKKKGFSISFELSHEDIRCSLYKLIESFNEQDKVWYFISEVYDEYFVMRAQDKIYGMKYVKKDDKVELFGDRYPLYQELLTEDEKAQLDKMRSDYEELKKKVEDKEKEDVLADEDYEPFIEDEIFKELIEDKDKYSSSEFKQKAELAFAQCVRKAGTYSNKGKGTSLRFNVKNASVKDTKKSRYGNIFKK